MTDDEATRTPKPAQPGHAEYRNARPDPDALALMDRFASAMRRDDLQEARSLAPDVEIRTDGWPYEDETGPLNPDAFRAGDPRDHEVVAWQRLPDGHVVVRTGITYLEMERSDDGSLLIVRGYHKPIE